jgi:hypothetical protein
VAEPGWYDDQHDPSFVRWWDGNRWTQHVQQKMPPVRRDAHAVEGVREPANRQEAKQDKRALTSAQRELQTLERTLAQTRERILAAEGQERASLAAELGRLRRDVGLTQQSLGVLVEELNGAKRELVNARREVELQEIGAYDFDHPGESSVALKDEIDITRREYKALATSGGATRVAQNFTFNNSAAQGRKFLTDLSKLALRSYNAEAENCVKTVRAGSLTTALGRLDKAKVAAERLGRMFDLRIDDRFHGLRRHEIELAARHLRAVERERELERARKEDLREQARAQKELDAARDKLSRERDHYLSVLSRLRESGDAEGVARMEAQLADVDAAIIDVDYRVAHIRAGYVYVISNVGAFGEGVVKIGMTRRLEPMDRVRELGDASVPFRFDVHALFFSKDAVTIETMLHHRFADARINKVNLRREFFRVSPSDVLQALEAENIEILEFTIDAAGEEYLASRGHSPVPPALSSEAAQNMHGVPSRGGDTSHAEAG